MASFNWYIHYAQVRETVVKGHLDKLKYMLSKKCPVNNLDEKGRTLIHIAAEGPSIDCLIEILKHDSSAINWSDKIGITALFKACLREKNSKEFVCVLLKNGADPNSKSHPSVLDEVIHLGKEEVAEILIEAGADVNNSGGDSTVLHTAAMCEDPNFAKLLIKNGAHIDVVNKNAETPIHYTIDVNCVRTLETILIAANEKGLLTLNEVNNYGETALALACKLRKWNKDLVSVLLQYGADPNIADSEGDTPLMHALSKDHENIVRKLLLAGADVNIANRIGNTPLHKAATKQDPTFVSLLLENGGNVGAVNKERETPIHCAVKHGSLSVIEALLEDAKSKGKIKEIINAPSQRGTAMKIAALEGFITHRDLLLQYGADLPADGSDVDQLFKKAMQNFKISK